MSYYSRHTGEEVDSLLDKVKEGDVVEVDTSLSSTSKNPVQNKVVTSALSNKQDKLISGTNIKTINGIPILGEGNIIISGGGTEGGVSYEEVEQMLAGKQNVIDDLDSIREGASKGATALQEEDLSSVAISGDYNDLTNKPTIPSAITEETVSGWGFTKNEGTYIKPDGGIPSSDLSNDVQSSLNKADTALQSYTEQYRGTVTGVKMNGEVKGTSGEVDLGTVITEHQDISGKQDVLVSGENIKTINGVSILGEGDIPIEGGGESYDDTELRNLISEKQDALVSGQNIKTINGSSLLGSGNIVIASEGGVSYDDTELRNLISNKVDKVEGKALSTNDFTDADKTKLDSLENYDDTNVVSLIRDKQDKLISGTNVKTINGTSILGEGNIEIEAGVYDDTELRNMIAGKQDTIEDLSTIRENASKGATALQSVPSEYINETELQQQLSTKADINGDYPDMSVGLAEDLGGRPFTNDAEFSFRATADKENSIKDGLASIKTLKGNSVVWNQQVQHESRIDGGCSSAWDGDVITIDGLSTQSYYSIMQSKIPCVLNEKFLIIAEEVANPNNLTFSIGLLNAVQDRATLGGGNTFSAVIGNSITTIGSGFGIDKFGGEGTDLTGIRFKVRVINLTKMFGEGNEPTTIEEFYSRCPIGIDMNAYNEGEVIHMTAEGIRSIGFNQLNLNRTLGTVTSGSGNTPLRPEILDESLYFIGLSGNNYYNPSNITDYSVTENSVSITSKSGYGVSFARRCLSNTEYRVQHEGGLTINVGFYDDLGNYISMASNLKSGETFTTLKNATWMNIVVKDNGTYTNPCVSLNYSYNEGTYKPYEEFTLSLVDQRIKDEFPDGMKKWDKVYNKDGKGYIAKGTGVVDMGELDWWKGKYFGAPIPNAKITKSDRIINHVVCAKYTPTTFFNIYWNEENSLGLDDVITVNASVSDVCVYDSSYTDVESFKAAMAGVILYYELSEPTIIEYDEPFNLDYKVADFGTEQAIGSTPSAPISAEIEYDFGANDTIRTNKLAINELREKIKEVAIEDIDTIREGAAKGMTAIQEHQDISHLATKEELAEINTAISNRVELKYYVRDISPVTLSSAALNSCYIYTGAAGDVRINKLDNPTSSEARYEFRFSGATSLTIPSKVIWANGEVPEIDSTAYYELSIVATQTADGYVYKAVLGKFM